MDIAAILVMLVVLLALAGVLVYLIRDYFKYKETIDSKFADVKTDVDSSISTEKNNRLSNMKYVVDQVNDVNIDIYNTISSNVASQQLIVNDMRAKNEASLTNFNKVMKFTNNDNIVAGTPAYVTLTNMPGVANVDINLMKKVAMISGMTAKNLDATKQATFCSAEDPARCIKFPDANGNTYLTNLKKLGGSIIMDAPTVVTDTLNLKKGATDSSGGTQITAKDNKTLNIAANAVGIGSTAAAPTATLHVHGDGKLDVLKVTAGASDAILVDATGMVTVPSLQIRSGANVLGTIGTDGNAVKPGLQITSASGTVTVAGDLNLTGQLKTSTGSNVA